MTNTIKLLFLKSQVVVFLLIPFVNYAQNVGVNQENPTNTLHVTPQNPSDEPLRIDGLTLFTPGDSALLIHNPNNGVVRYITMQNLSDTLVNTIVEDQTFLDSIVSIIYNYGDTLLYNNEFITNLQDSIDTHLDSLTLSGNILTGWVAGTPNDVDLSGISSDGISLDSIVNIIYNYGDTLLHNEDFITNLQDSIDTHLDSLTLNGNILTGWVDGTPNDVDLTSLVGTDEQTLTLSGTDLSISNGNTVDLSDFANDWKLDGNAGTDVTSNFLGTTDNEALSLRTNGNEAVLIGADATSSVGSNDDGLVTIHNRLTIGSGGVSHPTLNGSLLLGDGAPDIFSGGISLYSLMTPADHWFQGGIRMHNAITGTDPNSGDGGGLLALQGNDLLLQAFGSGDITFNTQWPSQERMRISNSGSVGIGTDTPSPNALLHLQGESLNMYLDNPNGSVYTLNSTNGGDLRIFRVGSGMFPFTVANNGNVGIGYPGPQEPLHVNNPTNTLGEVGVIELSTDYMINNFTTGVKGRFNNLNFVWDGPGGFVWENGGSELVRIQANGTFRPGTDGSADLGTATNRWNTLYATNGTINTSDRRKKKAIEGLAYGIEQVMLLNPVRFEWKEDEKGEKKIGFIAQELMEVLPETVKKGNDKNETMGVYYADIIPVLTKAIQQQQELIEKQQQEIESLKAESERNESLRVLIDKQSKDIELLHEHISSIQSVIEGGQVQIEEKDVVSQD